MNTTAHLYALIAGEASGDTLGAGLMMAIKRHDPKAKFIGIGGPKMIACGMHSSFRMSDLSVMGITEVISNLPSILKIRTAITKILKTAKPCVFIGIDSPDFNLTVEKRLKQQGIATIHYVSPSVWAWRQGRMKKIRASCDRVLALLSFEKEFYDKQKMPCTYVGHTLAANIPLEIDEERCRERIDLFGTSVVPIEDKVMGILPGSRQGVIAHMLPIYTQAARLIKQRLPKIAFICSLPSYELAQQVKDIWLENAPDLSLTIYVGNPHEVIGSCNAVLLTSGTVALEAMLLKRPFCVAYKVSAVTAAIGRRMLKVNTYSLPNLIAQRPIVNEFIQEQCTPEALAEEMVKLLTSDNLLMKREFTNIHKSMLCNSDELAAVAVFEVLASKGYTDLIAQSTPDKNKSPATTGFTGNFKNDIEPQVTLPDLNIQSLGKVEKTEPKF